MFFYTISFAIFFRHVIMIPLYILGGIMKYRQFGNSGLIVPELTLGTMTFGKGDFSAINLTFDQQKANALVDAAMDQGITFFDTADMYGNGMCEAILGQALKGRRQEAIISTKHCFRSGEKPWDAGVNAKHLIQQTENSLKNLQTDYLDIVLLHNEDPITPIDETLRAMESLTKKGMVRYIGFSNYSAWRASAMIERQKALGYQPFTASQMHYSILNREVEAEFIPMSLYHGVGMMVWSPLSSGFLTGKYTKKNPAPTEGRLNTASFDVGMFDREKAYPVIEKLKEIAQSKNTSLTAIAIAWLLSKKVVSTVIIGVSKLSQLEDNVQGCEISLSEDEVFQIDKLTEPLVRYPKTFVALQDEQLKSAKTW